jgi:lipoprotein NlpD
LKGWFPLFLVLVLAGCATSQQAPVIERGPAAKKSAPAKTAKPATPEKDWRPDTYTVKKGDTLYSIGLEFGFDYKEIAQRNNIQPPYVIRVGQQLKLNESTAAAPAPAMQEGGEAVTVPLRTEPAITEKSLDEPPLLTEPKALKEPYSEQAMAVAAPPVAPQPPKPASRPAEPAKAENAKTDSPAEKTAAPATDDEGLEWSWPASGKILAGFNDAASSKGIDIAGAQGQAVLAAAPGKVVYSGSGLRGYGKLVIIKHNKTYLSAYAHNSQILVKEGQEVAKGQKIAEMGNSDTDRIKLHFEIRKLGKPVDPTRYLPSSPS